MTDKEKLIKRLRGLKQNKNLSDSEIEQLVNRRLEEEELREAFYGLTNEEIEKGVKLYFKYLADNSFESLAEKSTLINIIYKEILKMRMQEFIKKESENKDGAVPISMSEKIMEMDTQILSEKTKLGMLKDKTNSLGGADVIEDLKARFKTWINKPENRSEYECQCHNCGQVLLIRRRIDKEKDLVKEHPWYINGGTFFNKEIFKDYINKKITKQQVCRYLDCAEDYLEWILKNYPMEDDK